jgi:hypothetical protein
MLAEAPVGYRSDMRQTTPDADDQAEETLGGSTTPDPETSNDPGNGAGDTDNTGDDLDAPDPS